MVYSPAELKLELNVELGPPNVGDPPFALHEWAIGSVPDTLAEQLNVVPVSVCEGVQLMLSMTGRAATMTVDVSVVLATAVLTVSETVWVPAVLKVVEYLSVEPADTPPLHAYVLGSRLLVAFASQVTLPLTATGVGQHEILLIIGGHTHLTVVDPLSCPDALVTYSEMVRCVDELKLVLNVESVPLAVPSLHE